MYGILQVTGVQYNEKEPGFAKKWKHIPNTGEPASG